jgi:hypothetical protein
MGKWEATLDPDKWPDARICRIENASDQPCKVLGLDGQPVDEFWIEAGETAYFREVPA